MQASQVGLTKLHKMFHSNDSSLEELRELLVQIDRAVATSYGWTFDLGHGFHETKQGTRFTISPLARAKVLDLLLALNHERYAAEQKDREKLPPKRTKATKGRSVSTGVTLLDGL